MEAECSVMRPYPTRSRGGKMSGDDHHGAIGEGFEEAPPCRARRSRVDAKAAVELGFGALQRRMHDIAAQDHGCSRRPHHDTHVAGRVPGPGLDPYVVVEGVTRCDQFGLATV